MKNAFLIGEKVYLRPLEKTDAPVLQAYINDPDVIRTLDQHLPRSLHYEEAWLDGLGKDESIVAFGIALKKTDTLIGATDLRSINARARKATFGISIGAKEEWNKGYGTEATRLIVKYGFDTLNLNRIALHVYENNPKAIRAYEKVGFVREGRYRQCVFREGRYLDVICMAVLREEWEQQQSKVEGRKSKAETPEMDVLTEV